MRDATPGTTNQESTIRSVFYQAEAQDDPPQVQLCDPQFELRGLSWNPLCDAAMPLIGLVMRLQSLAQHSDALALHQNIHHQIVSVMEEVAQLDYEPSTLKAYSYSLCLLVDEVVMATAWGFHCEWRQRPLLSAFHHESWGGEKFFTLLARMSSEAAKYQHVLEFMYLCLCVGLKGKYGNQANGEAEVQKIISQLHGVLRPLRGETPRQLTEPLRNIAPRNYRIKRSLPLWTPWALAAVVLVAAYSGYSLRLNTISEQVLVSLERILSL
ncbi:type IVB secretion system protein IcmH/DotU [Pseudomonas sp. LF19]|uniref:type IVB secretion system protein IcmH/DotU n=1 Tax=Pseudomonas sp. LF19 TaxID=2899115 RepID=UPI000FBEAC3E|nr:type IVB secretion system protein IcmH/DotU [Pseudomonas sp. LF19]MCE5980936.1 type IVB secretion system protein IcmH/DotU [Pseudomonas sp. LF19]